MKNAAFKLVAGGLVLVWNLQAHGSAPRPAWGSEARELSVRNAAVTGVSEVFYAGGVFLQNGPNSWVEKGVGYQDDYTEIGRDEWSVYLEGVDGYRVQLDTWTKKIKYSTGKVLKMTGAS